MSAAPHRATLPDGFTVLHVADDDNVLNLVAAGDPNAGRIAIRARPGTRRTDWLSRDLLAALGADFTVSGAGRNADENLQLLPVRLVSQRVTDILVDGAEQLTPTMIGDLAMLAAAARARLWLVTRPPVTVTIADVLADWCATDLPVEAAAAHWPRPQARHQPPTRDAGAPTPVEPRRLPLVDATTLLATARAQLPDAQAAWVEARLSAAVTEAYQRLTGDDTLDAEVVAGWLLEHYDAAGTLTQFVTDARALQIAALWRGLLVQVDLPALMGTASAAPSAAARTPQVWRRLRAYRLPVRAAACALAAARLSTTQLRAVTIADTAADGSHLRVDGRTITIEAAAAEYVATQRLHRIASGAPDTAVLLADTGGKALTDKALARLLSEARAELGIVVTSRLVERAAPDTATTLRRWGVNVTPIGDPVPATPRLRTTSGAPVDPDGTLPAAPDTSPEALLDTELIRRRRIELRLSRRDVAKHLGVTTAVVARLESGVNHAEQPLALLLRLAGLLAVDLPDLLGRRHPTPATGETSDGAADGVGTDARQLGASLHALGVLVPAETLAEVLGWDAARLDAALDVLAETAPAAGLRVHRLYNRISLVRAVDALPTEQLQAVLRYDAVRAGLDPTSAHLVHAALTRAVVPASGRGGRHMLARSNAEKVAAASLVGAGILTTDDVGDLALHPDTAASLLVPAPTELPDLPGRGGGAAPRDGGQQA